MEQEPRNAASPVGELDPESPEYTTVADRLHHIDSEFRNRDGYAIESAGWQTCSMDSDSAGKIGPAAPKNFREAGRCASALAKLLLGQAEHAAARRADQSSRSGSRNWLESYLADYPFAVVLIPTIDTSWNVTVNRTVEIWNKKVHFYSGNYERYLAQKESPRSARVGLPQPARAHRTARGVHQSLPRAATKARQVQSRIKELEKIERVEVSSRRANDSLFVPSAQAERRIVAELRTSQKLRRKTRLQRRELYHRARRPHRSRRNHGARQVDHDQGSRRDRASDLRPPTPSAAHALDSTTD